MYSDDDLNAAVKEGVLSADSAQAFRDFVGRRQGSPGVDEEHFRLISGFNDIFVSIAAVLILVALGWLGSQQSAVLGAVAVAAASWGFAEYFTRRRRMALPSIILLQSFVAAVFMAGMASLDLELFVRGREAAVGGCAALAAASAYVHWLRFKVPITVAAGTLAALVTALMLLLAVVPPGVRDDWQMPLTLAGGIGAFALAMRWDASDRSRTSRRSDVAFWLHLCAAPLIVHPAFSMLGLLGHGEISLTRAGIAVGIYLVLALVAIAVDRRALLISALVYVLYAMSALFEQVGAVSESFALTALVIGSALLLLSAAWHRARAALVGQLPVAIQARLPVV